MTRIKKSSANVSTTLEMPVPYFSVDPKQIIMFPDYNSYLEKPVPKRPTFSTVDKKPVYTALAKEILEWSNDSYELNDVIEILKRELDSSYDFQRDGYDLTKSLEKDFYDVDSDFVEIMNRVRFHYCDAIFNATKAWVSLYNIKSKFNLGDNISLGEKNEFGVLVKYYPETAQLGIGENSESTSLNIFNQENCKLKDF